MQKTRDVAFFKLRQNISLLSMIRYKNILLAGISAHIYGQLSLVTFLVLDYYGKSTVEDSKLGQFMAVNGQKGPKNLNLKFWREKLNLNFSGIMHQFGHLWSIWMVGRHQKL